MNSFLFFISMAFPKAGIQIASVPLTISTVLLALSAFKNINYIFPAMRKVKGLLTCYAVLFFALIFYCIFNLGDIPPFALAEVLVLLGSPLAIAVTYLMEPEKAYKMICVAIMITSLYAAVQWVAGITSTAIPGITYTKGQNITEKPIGYGFSDNAESTKMISTYQNGNGFGLFLSMAFPCLLCWKPTMPKWQKIKIVSLLMAVAGIILCGSRSVQIPFILTSLFMFASYQQNKSLNSKIQFWMILFEVALAFGAFIYIFFPKVANQFFDRLVIQTSNDTTMAGRTGQWAAINETIKNYDTPTFLRFLAIGKPALQEGGGEGLPEFLIHFGLIATVAFFASFITLLVACWKKARPMSFGILCVIMMYCVDQAYYYPPTLMLCFMFTMLSLRYQDKKATVRSHAENETSKTSERCSDLL
ncbi:MULTISPECIES: O-antigen ligase [Caproicibacterium]|jgi:hypothetical protein|uniref:O-antigen ligase domain-containing protein n=1 Tax=Caproicibacterium lactatifermentans TaxID=2666138 RepID=A0A859DQ89_9FIRM|nr:hypothetical protein [Caproicibacterium lactatifermentans]QKN23689.1 hypothetical protein GJQ69_03875 [Caproicibacterium lactatifermentans]